MYIKEKALKRLLEDNESFNLEFAKILRCIAYMEVSCDARKNRSTEVEYFHQERLKKSRGWTIRELCRLNAKYRDNGGFMNFVSDLKDEAIQEEILCEIYDFGVQYLEIIKL